MRSLTTLGLVAARGAATPTLLAAQGIGGEVPDADRPPSRVSTRGANFLNLPIGARGSATAGALQSFVDDGSAMYWNVAGLAQLEQFSVMFSRHNLYTGLDISQNYASVALPLLGGVAGVSFNSLNSGDIERTTEANPFGDNVVGTTYSWTSTAIQLAYSRRITDRLNVGASGKLVTEGITNANTRWVALDFGTQFRTGLYGLLVGANLVNVGGASQASGSGIKRVSNNDNFLNRTVRVGLPTTSTDLPTSYRFSLGADLIGSASSTFGQLGGGQHTVLAEANLSDAIDGNPQFGFGGEYGFRNFAFVRAGKRFYNDDRANGTSGLYGLSGGLGIRVPVGGRGLRFDYAYTSMGDLDNVQVFTFELGR